MIAGDPTLFAIEHTIAQAYERLSQRGLGYFVVHLQGRVYGVQAPSATLLACSFDSVRRRLSRRGLHSAPFGNAEDAATVVEALRAVQYQDGPLGDKFFGLPIDEVRDIFVVGEIVWAPDGDEAFDDGSHILQFDCEDKVRLIAFKNSLNSAMLAGSLTDTWMDAEEYYGVLDQWQAAFEAEWKIAVGAHARH